eukprot:scaffold19324_cov152-Cylindrotheca_fusiformis.AAC.10
MAAPISYMPEPHERGYYLGLFQAADVKKTNNIGGQEAVQFFARSKLPMDVLKNIWTVADQPSTSTLNHQKFAVAIRLIQLAQNGIKGQGPNLAVPPGTTLRPAYFEGVSGSSVPMPQAPGGAGGPPQQGQQPPPPQQQQQQPQQQQHQMQTPPSPSSNRGGFSNAPGPTNALVAQDPYSMTPQERKRYEDVFPQYAKPDGFVYGSEAVALFMKSGVDAQVLRELWNMVDRPVDNRLDKLEFAIAMHLIVCISKKNLPPPKGQLPPTLLALKKQGPPPTPSLPPRPPAQPQQQQQQQPPQQQQQPPPQQQQQPQQQNKPSQSMQPPQQQQQQQQPSLAPQGGMSITDAFEGMSVMSGMGGGSVMSGGAGGGPPPLTGGMSAPEPAPAPSLPSYVPDEQQQQQQQQSRGFAQPEPEPVQQQQQQPPAPAPKAADPPPPTTQQLASNYKMGDDNEELDKLKTILQKLQAENISLKAQLGTMTQEERDVQKELSATVAEIGSLSNQLQTLRSEVLDAKTKLLEASSQVKAAREQKSVLTGLIGEATETKAAIEDATESMKNVASSSVYHHEQAHEQKEIALEKTDNFESNLFGFENGPSMTDPSSSMHHAPSHSFDSRSMPDQQLPMSQSADVSLLNQPPSSPRAGFDAPATSTVSSMGELTNEGQQNDQDAPSLFDHESSASAAEARGPSPMPPPYQHQQHQHGERPTPEASQQYHQAPPYGGQSMGIPTPNPSQQYHQAPPYGGIPTPPNQGQQYHQMPPPGSQHSSSYPTPQPSQQYMQQSNSPIATPQYGLARPKVVDNSNRMESVGGFGSDYVMGGSAPPSGMYDAPGPAPQQQQQQQQPAQSSSSYSQEDMARVEELKRKARAAQETANDAATTHIKLAQEADELRSDADKAEANSRSLRAAADEKKKGMFGGGKNKNKKQLNREADNAAETAAELRKRFMSIQAQAHDAQQVARETKREAERLKEEAEKAEMEMVSAASMNDQQGNQDNKQQSSNNGGYPPRDEDQGGDGPYGYPPANGYPPAYSQPPPQSGYGGPPPSSNGYGGYGQSGPPQYGNNSYGGMPPPEVGGGYGQPASGGDSDPYANPFG